MADWQINSIFPLSFAQGFEPVILPPPVGDFIFDGPNKLIIIKAGVSAFSLRDLWSRWVDWWLYQDNSRFARAMRYIGIEDIDPVAGTLIPLYLFFQNGWRLRPQEANHTLNVTDGVLVVDGGGDPFVDTLGTFIVRINYQQPVQAISFSTSGGSGTTPDAVWAKVMESGYSAEEMMRLFASVLLGKVSGAGTPTETFRDINDTKDRVIADVDVNGNRTDIALDET